MRARRVDSLISSDAEQLQNKATRIAQTLKLFIVPKLLVKLEPNRDDKNNLTDVCRPLNSRGEGETGPEARGAGPGKRPGRDPDRAGAEGPAPDPGGNSSDG